MAEKNQAGSLKRFFVRFAKFALVGLALFITISVVQVVLFKYRNPSFTVRMGIQKMESWLLKTQYAPPSFCWKNLTCISPHLKKAVLAGEDQRFLNHHGFDMIEIRKALEDMIDSGRVRGASTITMQAARSVFLWHGRSVMRKVLEAYYTVLMEIFWSKERILEVYLNTVDWGRGVVGAEAASKKYFNNSACSLDASQSALLAAILPSPHTASPKNPSQYIQARKKRILNDMRRMPLL